MSLYIALSGSMTAQICPFSSSCCSGLVVGNPRSTRLLFTSLLTCSDTPAIVSGSLLQTSNRATIDSRLHSCCATRNKYFLIFIVEQNLVGFSDVMFVVFYHRFLNTYDVPYGDCVKTWLTSSTKPEIHNVSQCRQRRTEPRPQATCIKMQADRHQIVSLSGTK